MSYHSRGKMNANANEFVPALPGSSSSGPSSGGSSSGNGGGGFGWKNPAGGSSGRSSASSTTQARPRKQEQRRPDRRGGSRTAGGGGQHNQVVAAYANDYEDAAALQSPNKRGQISLNHLLSFQMPPRQRPTSTGKPVRRKSNVYYEPYNKERFVNANFRFIMDEKGDYTVNVFDPDIVVDWKDVVQAVVPITKPPSCPICLSPPIASKVTKCGHVYCWPCITHYLELGEKKWRKCPICYDAIYAKDLKPARFSLMQEVGKATTSKPAKVQMVLMKRAMNSAIALPRQGYHTWADAGTNLPPSVHNANAVPYAKLLLSSPEYLQAEILEREQEQLKALLGEAVADEAVVKAMAGRAGHSDTQGGMSSERPFIEVALQEVKVALNASLKEHDYLRDPKGKQVNGTKNGAVVSAVGLASVPGEEPIKAWSAEDLTADVKKFQTDHSTESGYEAAFSDEEASLQPAISLEISPPLTSHELPSTAEPNPVPIADRKKQTANPAQPPSDGMYYFYQSADGQHLYLHPLDIKVLKYEYETYDRFPDRIEVDVIKVQESTMTDDLRRRCKYLAHIALRCDVSFCEIDHVGLVKAETRRAFDKELTARTKRYRAAELKDQQEHVNANRRGATGLSTSTVSIPNGGRRGSNGSHQPAYASSWEADYAAQFPTAGNGSADAASNHHHQSDTASDTPTASPPLPPSAPPPSSSSSSSFARMAAASGAKAQPWTRRAKPARSGRSRWSDDDDDDEDGYYVDDYQGWTLDFEEAVMGDDRFGRSGGGGGGGSNNNNVTGPPVGGATKNAQAPAAGGKKKKGAKKVTLVTNGGKRGRQ
ncbi:RING finger protein 10 [Geranomyces variabilis]|uniref:RING finger protein 10 n=1 Tax=Geranomyces variabilis TaxID=109894 RepID=A0AAD5THM6_9FUNG|nr:RING finger protein 10 [Geranomyces variabilis]